ncbi:M13 family peptidase [Sphingomonas gilva]|uniref:M13 family peptidase n=1 Tax=Sphingomonas gilva TaxID=2305907 RepID=A0A396RMQ0_9SPHN|nr:M13 family metallopeptidase [Sphingomonas gilva]RHW16422.1 M13 family peptidase [Sphingomonas gilva]
MKATSLACLLLATTALSACATTATNDAAQVTSAEQTEIVSDAAAGPVEPAAAPGPQIGSYGFDAAGMDRAVAPGDDFDLYANGTWKAETEIPADRSSYGAFHVLDDLSLARTRAILEELRSQPASKSGAAYASFMNQAGIEAKGLAPFKPWIDDIKSVKTHAEYAKLIGRANRIGVESPFGMGAGIDDKNPVRYALSLAQAGLAMPDRDYYLKTEDTFVKYREAYRAHIAKMFTLAGEPDADARAARVLAFETELAKVHWTREESRDADKTYNLRTFAQLEAEAPGFDWRGFFSESGVVPEDLIVVQPSAITASAALVAKTPVETLKDALLIRSLDSYASYLPKAFDDERFAFFSTTLSGTPQQRERWKRGVSFVSGILGEDVGKIYVERHFDAETKAVMDDLVKNVIAAMDRRLQGLTWMAPETKVKARAKLAAFTPKIGYPSNWRDYSALEIRPDDALGNAMRAQIFEHERQLKRLPGPVDRTEWLMTPMTINAYANPTLNEIVFPAAILQPPFFDPKADPAINYGGIGAVIGHEISHHFDDQGRKYDATGRLSEWWTPEDEKRFEALTDKLVAQYDAYEPLPGQHVSGRLTLGENIGDLAGLTVAYDAYRASLGGKEAPVIDGMTGDQRFYLGWAQVWRTKMREAALRQQLLSDPHSPGAQRIWVVRNLDPWSAAFDTEGGKLHLAPDARVRIW